MSDALYEDNLIQDVEISPKDQLKKEFEELLNADIQGVVVEDFAPEIIEGLNECEIAMALAAVRSTPLINEIYRNYIADTDYKDWNSFWNGDIASGNEGQIKKAREVAAIYFHCADLIPSLPEYRVYQDYLSALGAEWVLGHGRNESEAELLWYSLPYDYCRFILRSSSKMEEGAEAYTHSDRKDGGTASLTLRLILESSKQSSHAEGDFLVVEDGVLNVLDAHDEWRDNFIVDYETHVVFLRTAMHGGSTGPTAHQYKRARSGSPTRLKIITNRNLQQNNSAKFLSRIDNYFTEGLVDEMKSLVIEDIPSMRSGHEVAEAIMERIYSDQIDEIAGREAVELLATLIPIEGIIRKINEAGDSCDVLSEKMIKRFITGYADLMSREFDEKLLPYIRGDQFAMRRLVESGGVIYDEIGKIKQIDIERARPVISNMVVDLLGILKTGDKSVNDQLFELTQ